MFVLNRERNEEEWRNGERARGKKNETKKQTKTKTN